MKVFVAGATGVLGRSAIRALVDAGHDVTGVARGDDKAAVVASLGARAVRVDLFDGAAVRSAVEGHDAVCSLASNIPSTARAGFAGAWRTNSRLWRASSSALADAAIEAGATVFVQHSVTMMYAANGTDRIDESHPFELPAHGQAVVDAEAQVDRFAAFGGRGVTLRFAVFYGPDAQHSRDAVRLARLGIAPMPGSRDAFISSIHSGDLGPAVAAALDAPAGVYNVCDEPVSRDDYLGALAAAVGRRRLRGPRRVPLRTLEYITRSQRVSSARFREATRWTPSTPSVREGWPATVAAMRAGTR